MKRMKLIVTLAALAVLSSLVSGCAPDTYPVSFTPGTFIGVGPGGHGPITVEVDFSDTEILSVVVLWYYDTPSLAARPVVLVPAQVVENQSLNVHVVAGSTATSQGILRAIWDAVDQAGANPSSLMARR
jgi:fumarate reductase flavoprotein subunit